ncbi:hypothetical protein K9M06_05265 [Candidatus Bipolaricaulota bacterium]|nr:hypothetical protein [Candidatus Bipolaricaulota bacterium]
MKSAGVEEMEEDEKKGNGGKQDNPGNGNKGGPSDSDEDEELGNLGKSKGKGN